MGLDRGVRSERISRFWERGPGASSLQGGAGSVIGGFVSRGVRSWGRSRPVPQEVVLAEGLVEFAGVALAGDADLVGVGEGGAGAGAASGVTFPDLGFELLDFLDHPTGKLRAVGEVFDEPLHALLRRSGQVRLRFGLEAITALEELVHHGEVQHRPFEVDTDVGAGDEPPSKCLRVRELLLERDAAVGVVEVGR